MFNKLNRRSKRRWDLISEFIEAVQRHVLSVEEAREIIALYNSYASWLEELHLQDFLDNCLVEISV